MYLFVSWTKFRFDPPAEITEAQYVAARDRPGELRVSVRGQLRTAARQAALPTVFAAAVAAGCLWVAGWFDSTNPRAWSTIVGNVLVLVSFAAVLSAVFTAGSFLRYVAAATRFWRAVARTARDSASYPEFLAAFTQWRQARAAGPRKLPWWLSWLVLAGVLLAAYYGLSWYFAA